MTRLRSSEGPVKRGGMKDPNERKEQEYERGPSGMAFIIVRRVGVFVLGDRLCGSVVFMIFAVCSQSIPGIHLGLNAVWNGFSPFEA